jgi:ceramide glucosyltransferase
MPTGLSMGEAVVATHLAVSLVVYLVSAGSALARRWRPARVAVSPEDLVVSVLKPMRGLDPHLEENLRSFAALEAPEAFEVLLLVDSPDDEALPLARQLEARFPRRVRVVVGTTPGHGNPKVASLLLGLREARNPMIWVTDSNTETSDTHLRAHLAAWKWAQRDGRVPTLVHAPQGTVGGSGLGAACERLHLPTYNNVYAETTQVAGIDAVIGKSLLFHRDDLARVGGLAPLGSASGEDYLLGRAFRKGGTVELAGEPNRQVLGEDVPLSAFWHRQARWAAVRKHTSPWTFYGLEHFTYFGLLWVWLALGLLPWPVVAGAFAIKLAVDGALQAAYSRRAPLAQLLLVPVKDLVVLLAWASAFFLRQVSWRGRQLAVGDGGDYLSAASSQDAKSGSEPQYSGGDSSTMRQASQRRLPMNAVLSPSALPASTSVTPSPTIQEPWRPA